MAAYVIGDIEVTDPAAFQEYRNRIGATLEQYGGKFVVRAGRVNLKEETGSFTTCSCSSFPASSRPSASTTSGIQALDRDTRKGGQDAAAHR